MSALQGMRHSMLIKLSHVQNSYRIFEGKTSNMANEQKSPPSTVVTLTLPETESEAKTGMVLVQHGDLARIHQFTYSQIGDLCDIIADSTNGGSPAEEGAKAVKISRLKIVGGEMDAATIIRPSGSRGSSSTASYGRANTSPVDLPGMRLLREQPHLFRRALAVPREQLVEAAAELVNYTGHCAEAAMS